LFDELDIAVAFVTSDASLVAHLRALPFSAVLVVVGGGGGDVPPLL